MVDFALAVLYSVFLIFSSVVVPGDWESGGHDILGIYGTVPLMVHVGSHGILVRSEVRRTVRHATDCPDPAHSHFRGRDEYTPRAGGVKAGYEDGEDGEDAL